MHVLGDSVRKTRAYRRSAHLASLRLDDLADNTELDYLQAQSTVVETREPCSGGPYECAARGGCLMQGCKLRPPGVRIRGLVRAPLITVKV